MLFSSSFLLFPGTPSDRNEGTFTQIAAYQLVCLEERTVVLGAGLEPMGKFHVALMSDVLGKHIEGYHARLMIVAHVSIESFEGGWRNSSTCFLLQIE